MSITPEQILKDSLTAIDDGLWTCHTIAEYCDGKVMGCALGLVGINAGLGEIKTTLRGRTIYELGYPEDGLYDPANAWPVEATDAVFALANTAEPQNTYTDLTAASEAVVAYNDGNYDDDTSTETPSLTAEQAKAWFTRALESVQA